MSTLPPPRRRARSAAATAVAAAVAGALLVPVPASAADAIDAHDVLTATTPAERKALAGAIALTAPDEIYVSEDVDLDATAKQDVIVVLRQPVASTARVLAQVDGEDLSAKDAEAAVDASQDRFVEHAADEGLGDDVGKRYDDVVNAVAMNLTGSEIAAMLASPDVASVWPNETIRVELPTVGGETPETGLTGGGATYDEVESLHQKGITGAGVKVGILDTGIDYNHPALAAVYQGGYDAVDNDDDPMETTYEDWKASGRTEKVNGSTYYTSHGTHVAGIVAGQDDFGGRSAYGIAPEADIYAYRVLGPYGGGSTADILEGMEHALADGMDVVNMSLGGSYNDHRSVLSIAADNLTLAGVTTVIAAGNDGELGAASLGSPGTSALALTVGANDSPLTLATTTATVGAASADLRLVSQKRDASSVTDLAGKSFRLIDVGGGNAAGYAGKSPAGAIVVIERGTITFNDMAANAKNRGAAGAIVVNNRPDGPIDAFIGESDSYAVMFGTDATQGAALRAAMAAGAAEVTFGTLGEITTDADRLAGFSSRGPSNGTTDIKPEVTAPGVSVMSSVPTWDVDPKADISYAEAYGRKSGTSMATPFVAGLAALMLDAEPDLAPADVKTRLMNTADDLADTTGVFESGAGQVDPRQAVFGTVDAQVIDTLWMAERVGKNKRIADITGALSLGMVPTTDKTTVTKTVEITNNGSTTAVFALAVDTAHGAGTADLASSDVTITVDKSVKVAAHATKKVKVTTTIPRGTAEGTYGAFITIAAPGAEEALRLPLGFRVDDAAISDFTMLKPVMSTGDDTFDPAVKFSAGVATPTRTLDLFLVDKRTGKDIGYVGGMDPTLMKDDRRYGPFAWYGDYLPITKDKKFPISHKTVTIEPGAYSLRLIGSDDNGSEYSRTADFYVDNTAPTVSTNLDDSYVHEFAQSDPGFPLSAKVIDGEVDAIRAAGIDIDQSDNVVQYFSTTITPWRTRNTDADGALTDTVPFNQGAVQGHRFLALDAAGNIGGRVETMWFRDTQPYVVGTAASRTARVGDTVTTSFVTNNATKFTEMRVEAYFNPRDTDYVGAVAQDGFAEYGRIAGDATITRASSSLMKVSIPLVFDGEREYTGDALPLIDLQFSVLDTITAEYAGFTSVSTFVKRSDGVAVQMQRAFDVVLALAPTSRVRGGFYAQGLLTEAGAADAELDHSTVGAKATLIAPDDSEFDVPAQSDGALELGGLPLFADAWDLTVTLPGHFTWYESLELSTPGADGKPAGSIAMISPMLTAGDVNGDDVIDILDAIAIRDAAGTANRAADVDFDGTVDAADLAFVESNWLVRNPTADTVPTPKAKHKGITLDAVLASFAD